MLNPAYISAMPPKRGHNGMLNLKIALQIKEIPKRISNEPKKTSSKCKQNSLYQIIKTLNFGVSGGDRTHDPQNHNLMLCQLSYTHRNVHKTTVNYT
jgi:hypothetical protein